MSRHRSGGTATSRRTRRGEQLPALAATAAGSVVTNSNPIFICEDGSAPARRLIKPGGGGYGPGSLHALVRGGGGVPDDDAAAAGEDDGGKRLPLPLPLPPSRAHGEGRCGARIPAWHDGPTIVVGPHGAVLRMRAPPPRQHDPFLAAYVACTKGRAGAGAGGKCSGQPSKKKTKKKPKAGARRGCGMWDGWAASGVMSCRHGSAVTVLQGAAPLPGAAAGAAAESPAHPTLDLTRLPAVLPGRRRPPHY
ncbi:uncharacterized protein LOC121053961 [Oryza brachyantha]|uniref:uncharacterized protein LOC121053961 n=1 Tax=Oryza brachyantha TaxID=4533 RepID=UPI001ADAC63C|nr:uncharacterized protein LOC121053961 [Oryza brachyantha]